MALKKIKRTILYNNKKPHPWPGHLRNYVSDDEAPLAGEQWDPQRHVKLREKSRASEFAITHFRGFQLKTQCCQY